MYRWERELRQAFHESIIRGQGFTALDIWKRIQALTSEGHCVPPVADYQSVNQELLSLIEKDRPAGWALTTIPIVDEDGTPRNIWQVTPISLLLSVEQMVQATRSIPEPRASILQRILAWGFQR
jgi:hypothetical protein